MKDIVKKYIPTFILVGILFIVCNVLSVAHPYIVKQVVDIDFNASNIIEKLLYLFIIYLSIQVSLAIFKNIRNIIFNKWTANVLKDIREKVFHKVLKFKMKTYSKYNSSEIYTRLTVDTDNLFDLFFNFLQIIVNNVTYIALMVIMMFFANVNLALIRWRNSSNSCKCCILFHEKNKETRL